MISYPFTAKPILDEGGQPVLDVNGFPTYDRTIDSAMERAFNKQKWTNGVYSYPTDGLQVVANTGMKVTLKRGGCQIEGAQGYNQSDLDITCSPSHSSLARIDRVVVRFDLNDSIRGIEVYKKEGTFSSVPVAPEITQEANYYELVVADVKIRKGATEITQADITDQRLNSELCGVVIPAIPTPLDTSTLYNQYQDSLEQYLSLVASAVNETLAGQLQTNIDAVQDNVDDSNGKIQLVQKYNVVTAVTNGDFKCTLDGLSTLTSGDVVKVSLPSATDNTAVARLSVDGGTTYKNIYKYGNLTAKEVENKNIELMYNGTQFEPTYQNNAVLLAINNTVAYIGTIQDLTRYRFLILAASTSDVGGRKENRILGSTVLPTSWFVTYNTSDGTCAACVYGGDPTNYTANAYYSGGKIYIKSNSLYDKAIIWGVY